MQGVMYSSQNWVYHHTSQPHNYMRKQMHAHRTVDDTPATRQSVNNQYNPDNHGR